MIKQTKTGIVDTIYKNSDYMLKDVQAITDSFFAEMTHVLKEGGKVEIRGFGTFSVRFRKGRKGLRNPKTNEPIEVQPHSVVVFHPGKVLSEAVRPLLDENK